MRDGIRNFARTQSVSIAKQLASGIRYLDFRIAQRSKQEYCLSHSVVGPNLDGVLADIKAFLDANPKEVVVVESKWVGDTGQAGYLDKVKSAMGTYYTSVNPNLLNQTLDQLVTHGRRFIFCDERDCINTSSYKGTDQPQSANAILANLKVNWNKGPFPNQLWQVSFCAKPEVSTYIIGVIAGLNAAVIIASSFLLGLITIWLPFLPPVGTVAAFEAWVAFNKPPTSLRDVASKLVSDNLTPITSPGSSSSRPARR